uniref:Uncharacterized protein n=1 Tax=Aspergillus pseudoviridinutans TaxID=1517512 RepID=A0A9P3B5J8_9EURO
MLAIQFDGIWLFPKSPRWRCAKYGKDEAFKHTGQASLILDPIPLHDIQNPVPQWKEIPVCDGAFFSGRSENALVSWYLHSILASVGIVSSYDQAVINGSLQARSFLVAIGLSSFPVDAFWAD